MSFEVRWTAPAAADLEEIIDWISEHDSPARAEHVLERIESTVDSLKRYPERGSHPPELLEVGSRDYRETFFKPYRILYRVIGQRVYVYLVADGRRDLQSLLSRRLLGG